MAKMVLFDKEFLVPKAVGSKFIRPKPIVLPENNRCESLEMRMDRAIYDVFKAQHEAIANDAFDRICSLLDYGVSVDYKREAGESALMAAVVLCAEPWIKTFVCKYHAHIDESMLLQCTANVKKARKKLKEANKCIETSVNELTAVREELETMKSAQDKLVHEKQQLEGQLTKVSMDLDDIHEDLPPDTPKEKIQGMLVRAIRKNDEQHKRIRELESNNRQLTDVSTRRVTRSRKN